MHTFRDNQARPWNVHIDVNTIRRVRTLLAVDLMKVVEGKLLNDLAEDPCLLVDVLFAIVQPQAAAAGITDIQFGEAMTGQALDDAISALLEDLVSFFRQGERKMLATLMQKLNRVYQARTDLAMKRMEAVPLDQMIEEAMAAGAPSTSSAQSHASLIPDQ